MTLLYLPDYFVLCDKVTRWFRLLDGEERFDEENPLGEIELSIQWIHDPRAKDLTRKMSMLEVVQRTLGERDSRREERSEPIADTKKVYDERFLQ